MDDADPVQQRPYKITAVNVVCGVAVIIGSKHLYSVWPYPVTAVAMQQIMVLAYTFDRQCTDHTVSGYLSATFAGSVAMSNVMLSLCTVGVYELLTAMRIPALLLVQYMQFKVKEPNKPVLAALVTVAFSLLGAFGSALGINVIGFAAGAGAALTAATSKATVKAYTRAHQDVQSIMLLRAQLPGTIWLLTMYAVVVERPVYPGNYALALTGVIGAAAIWLNITSFQLCAYSPLYYQQLSPLKTFLIVVAYGAWGDAVRTVSIIGTTLSAAVCLRLSSPQGWDQAPQRSLEYLQWFSTKEAVTMLLTVIVAAIMMDNYIHGMGT